MEMILSVNWLATIIGAVLAFVLGAIWYSPLMFVTRWKQGLGVAAVPGRSLALISVVQAIGTLLFSWVLVLSSSFSIYLAALIAITVAVLIKANGLFAGKSIYAIATETAYVLAQAVIILITYSLIK